MQCSDAARTAAVTTMLARKRPGAVVRVDEDVLSHTISCAKFSREDLVVISFRDFDNAFLLKHEEDGWLLAYPTTGKSDANWIDLREEKFAFVSREEILASEDGLILVWNFFETPDHLRFSQGGDEDLVALLPPTPLDTDEFFWLNDYFGCCSVDFIDLSEWHSVAVGSHS
jgi:hypothetical protein